MRNHIFTQIILEYKPKVTDGKLTWETEPFYSDGDSGNVLPDKFSDLKNLKHIKAGKAAQNVDAKQKRDYSNTVRSFYED